MIKNLIFDFGGVLIPLDESLTWKGFKELGAKESMAEQLSTFQAYEKGEISTQDFLQKLKPHFNRKVYAPDMADAWNAMLMPIPNENIELLRSLKKKYRLFMLSNTNELHINAIKKEAGLFKYNQIYKQFEKVYYSYEMGMRKPDAEIFKAVLKNHKLKATETLYIEDGLKNIEAAEALSIKTWHFKPSIDSILDLDKVLSKHH
jgi:putative hydrolase of the HAD superfamily